MSMPWFLLLAMPALGSGGATSSLEPLELPPFVFTDPEQVFRVPDSSYFEIGESWFVAPNTTRPMLLNVTNRSMLFDRRVADNPRCNPSPEFVEEARSWYKRELHYPWQRELREQLLRQKHKVAVLSFFSSRQVEMDLVGLYGETVGRPTVVFQSGGTLLMRPLHMLEPRLRYRIMSLNEGGIDQEELTVNRFN